MLLVQGVYGGAFWDVIERNEFRLQYYMLVAPIVIMCLKKQHQIYQVAAALAVSLLIADLHIYWSTWNGALRPAIWGHGTVMITSMLYLMLIPMLMVLFFSSTHPWKIPKKLYVVLSVMAVVALICTATRGAWLAMLATSVPLLFYHVRSVKRTLVIFFSIAIFLAGVIGTNTYYTMNVTSIGDMNDISQAERLLLWKSCILMFCDYPFMGVGLGNFKREYDRTYMDQGIESFSGFLEPHIQVLRYWAQPEHAHSNYFQFVGEMGLLGLLTYTFFCFCILRWSWTHRTDVFARIFFFSTIALLLYGATDYTFAGFKAMRVYWLMLGMAGSSINLSISNQQTDC